MKTPVFALILLMFTVTVASHRHSVLAHAFESVETPVPAPLPVDSIIKVYFVSGMFSAEQRKALWDAMQNWKSPTKTGGTQIRFVDLGETNGLIDCHNCLTVVREENHSSDPKRRSSFNRLRQDHTGRLISAWIGLDLTASTTSGLRDLMLKALKRGLGAT